MTPVDARALEAGAEAVTGALVAFAADDANARDIAAAAIDAYLDARRPSDAVQIAPGGMVLLDALGAAIVLTQPEQQLAVILDVAGRYNRLERRQEYRLAFTVEQAAELIAELVVAVKKGGRDASRAFDAELEAHSNRLRDQVDAA